MGALLGGAQMTESPVSDPKDEATRDGLVRRYRKVCAEWFAAEEQAKYHQEQIAALENLKVTLGEQARSLLAVGNLFAFDIDAAYRHQIQTEIDQRHIDQFDIVNDPPPTQVSMPMGPIPRAPSVKDAVLEIAKAAYPDAVRAKDIRAELLKRGIATHEKTVGMTCYRWLQKNRLRRDGWNWFYLPTHEPATVDANDHGHNGATSAVVH
jgi:hypothetical protein